MGREECRDTLPRGGGRQGRSGREGTGGRNGCISDPRSSFVAWSLSLLTAVYQNFAVPSYAVAKDARLSPSVPAPPYLPSSPHTHLGPAPATVDSLPMCPVPTLERGLEAP